MNTLEVLTKARALVDKGWIQSNWVQADPRTGQVVGACAAGAIRVAAAENNSVTGRLGCTCGCCSPLVSSNPTALSMQVEQILGEVIGIHWQTIPEWNDMVGRTKEQVLAAFDVAIKKVTPPPTYDAAACVAEAMKFGESKVTYTVSASHGFKFIPDTVPSEWTTKVLVNTA